MNGKKSDKLFILFLIVFFIVGIAIGIASVIYAVNTGLSTMELPSDAKVIVGIIVLAGFCPALGFICKKAKEERVKLIYGISFALLIFIPLCVLSTIIPIICEMWIN